MADVVNVNFVEDNLDEIPQMPEELKDQACDTVGVVLSTVWAAGYLYGYEDGCSEGKVDGI